MWLESLYNICATSFVYIYISCHYNKYICIVLYCIEQSLYTSTCLYTPIHPYTPLFTSEILDFSSIDYGHPEWSLHFIHYTEIVHVLVVNKNKNIVLLGNNSRKWLLRIVFKRKCLEFSLIVRILCLRKISHLHKKQKYDNQSSFQHSSQQKEQILWTSKVGGCA